MNESLAAGSIRLYSLSTFSVAPTTTTRAKRWLRWTASSLPFLSWHVHSGGGAPGMLYLPPCGAHCLWQRRSAGMCGLPSHSGHLVETPARALSRLFFSGCV